MTQTKKLILSAMFLALALLLPFLTMQIPSLGSMLLPMHIPVLLAGFFCGWPYGLAVGAIAPVLRSLIFGMPPMFPTAAAMSFELAAYGLLCGLFYSLLPKKPVSIYTSLFLAMIGGRFVWGAVSYALYGIRGTAFTWELFIGGAVLNALPGIVLQIILIPLLVLAFNRSTQKENAQQHEKTAA